VLDVTDALRGGDNRLSVGVDSTPDAQTIRTPITDRDLYGGITRPVKLVYTPATFTDDATFTLGANGRITGEARLQGPRAAGQVVTVAIGKFTAIGAVTDANGRAVFDVPAPAGLQRWSPDSPTLYDVRFAAAGGSVRDRIGFRTIAVEGSRNDGMKKFTEEYQAEYYRKTLAMADRIPALAGMSPWILKDFQSPRREHPIFQNGWNRKGIVSETGVRKQASDVLSTYYRTRSAGR
jgi:hypothetical protein